jgi:hypothetical protein
MTFELGIPSSVEAESYMAAELENPNGGARSMGRNGSDSHSHRWGVILAGGDGTQLLPVTRGIHGDHRPMRNETLLLRAGGLGWSDLGEPSRVRSALERAATTFA